MSHSRWPTGIVSWAGADAAMRQRLISAASGALWSGVVCAVLGAIGDFIVLSRIPAQGPFVFYFLAGWLGGFAYGTLSGAAAPPVGTAILTTGFLSLYPLNVSLLRGEPWTSGLSIASDVLLLSLFLMLIYSLRPWSYRSAPVGRRSAVVGVVALATSAGILFWGSSVQPAPDKRGDGPDILLIVLDCVRRDHVSFLGYSRKTGEPFERYLADSRIYERAYSTASWTVPSSLDILGVQRGQDPASGFPARLASLGYATLMLTNNPHLAGPPPQHFGFEEKQRSVPEWRYRIGGSIGANVLDRIRGGNDRGLADNLVTWIVGRKGPVYVHAHLMNAHTPFKFPPIDKKSRPGRRIEFPMPGQVMTEAEADSIVARYDEGIRTAFAAAWRMIETMRSRHRPLLVLLTADHGELLGESRKWFHGIGLDEELLRIPLLAWGEGVTPGRVRGLASNAQLAETIMAAARGETAPRDLRTSSGIDQVEGGLPDDSAFRIRGSHKVVISKNAPIRLYLLDERGGVSDVTSAKPKLAKLLSAGLTISGASPPPQYLDESTVEALRSLGYIK